MRSLPFAMTIAGAVAASLLSPTLARAAGPAQRIVSLNLCTDELLLRLADPAKVASVTWLSRDPSGSNVADLAERVPINHGLAEQVIAADPDLVLAGTFTTRIAVGMLKRTAIPVVELGVPRSFDDVRKQIREVAALVQAEERGRQLIDEIDRRIAAVAGKPREHAADRGRAESERLHRRGGHAGRSDHDRGRARQHCRKAPHRQLRPDPAGDRRPASGRCPDRQRQPRRPAVARRPRCCATRSCRSSSRPGSS